MTMSFPFDSLCRVFAACALSLSLTAAAETCRLPQKIAVSIPADQDIPLDDLKALCAAHGCELTAVTDRQTAFLRFETPHSGAPKHPQGYLLEVADGAITVGAHTREGLFNGLRALNDLLRRSTNGELPRVRIAETPSIEERAICFSVAGRSLSARETRTLKRFIRVLAALRYNRVLIDFGTRFHDRRIDAPLQRPLPSDEAAVVEIAEFAAAEYIRIVPLSRGWVKCPRQGDGQKSIRSALIRQCDLLNAGEVRFRIDWNALESHRRQCPECRKVSAEKLLDDHLDFLVRCAADAKARPGFILPDLPNEIAARIPKRLPAGTPLFGITANGRTPDTAVAGRPEILLREIAASARGGAGCFIVREDLYTRNGDIAGSLYNTSPHFLGGMVQGAFAMWQPARPRYPEDPVGYFRTLLPGGVRPRFFRKATPVPIWTQLTAELGATGAFPRFEDKTALEKLRDSLRNSPEHFELSTAFGNRYYGILLTGSLSDRKLPEHTDIPLGGVKAAGIALLLSCSRPQPPSEFDPGLNGRRAFSYGNVATVVIDYADGERFVRSLKYRRHISAWDEPFGGYDRRTAAAGCDADRRRFRFDVLTIRNPHPAKPIKALRFQTLGLHGIAPALLAVSLLDAEGGALPDPAPCDELLRLNFRPTPVLDAK